MYTVHNKIHIQSEAFGQGGRERMLVFFFTTNVNIDAIDRQSAGELRVRGGRFYIPTTAPTHTHTHHTQKVMYGSEI